MHIITIVHFKIDCKQKVSYMLIQISFVTLIHIGTGFDQSEHWAFANDGQLGEPTCALQNGTYGTDLESLCPI